ncbi:MAG: MarR family transcriptional regulator [Betaproteobacteria bacterium]|nr:MarR family transcriptional regulator [Betaproteobacteria bacterium]
MADKPDAVTRSGPRKMAAARAALELDVRRKLRILFSSAKLQSREITERCGVSAGQLWALSEVDTQPGLCVSDLAKLLYIKNSTVSNLLDRLEQRGWVRRERSGKDQRVVRLFLTTTGSKLVVDSPVPPRGIVSEALRLISLDSLESLDHSLDEVVARLALKDIGAGLTPLAEI